jgi:hypothetical protein
VLVEAPAEVVLHVAGDADPRAAHQVPEHAVEGCGGHEKERPAAHLAAGARLERVDAALEKKRPDGGERVRDDDRDRADRQRPPVRAEPRQKRA